MKHRYILLIALLLPLLPFRSIAQTTKADPFQGHYLLRDRQQLVVLKTYPWLIQQTYNYEHLPAYGDSLMSGPAYQYPDSLGLLWQGAEDGGVDIVACNVSGDRQDEVVGAWHTQDSSLLITVWRVEPYTHNWDQRARWKTNKDSLYFDRESAYTHCNRIRVLAGQFDGDEFREFLVAYISADTMLTMILYDPMGDFQFTKGAQAGEQKLFVRTIQGEDPFGTSVERFDIALADLDKDGRDEVVVAGVEPDGPDGWRGFLKSYDVDLSTKTFLPMAKRELFHSPAPVGGALPHGIKVVAGEFDTTRGVECCIAWRNNYVPVAALARISPDMLSISVGDTLSIPKIGNSTWLALASGDLNGDDISEIITCSMDVLRIFRAGAGLKLEQLVARGSATLPDEPSSYFYADIGGGVRALVVADVNSDSGKGWSPEIVTFEDAYKYASFDRRRIRMYGAVLDSARNITGIVSTSLKNVTSNDFGIMAAGRFDPGDVRLGAPALRTKSNIVQPLVILNAPPVHFDVFDGAKYDVCRAFGGTPPGFSATYSKTSSSSVEVQTEVSRTWAQSNSLQFGFSVYGLGVEASMENRYGKGFSGMTGSSRTISSTISIDAINEDRIFATVASYDLWEYPVYAEGNLIGHVLVLDPNSATIQPGWFGSRDWTANSYVPDHEVGNVLSYQRFSELGSNPSVDELLKGNPNTFFSLDATSSYGWKLEYADFQSSGLTRTKSLKTSYSLTGGGFLKGIGALLGGGEDYDDESISTHTTSVGSDLSLRVTLGSLNMGLGEVSYDVTPYTYWAKNGALVLDYAVTPDLAAQGGTPTWWQVRYNKQDPAFILPWRYDRQKGYDLQDSAKRLQTKEITFHPADAERGDTILIVARVRNFGLINTEVPVAVRFYVGHPDSGGTLLVGSNGVSRVMTQALVPARGSTTVQLPWRIPSNIPQFPRIYALINPDTVMDEVHTNNNLGFAVLNLSSLPTGVTGGQGVPGGFALAQNYPNPFNPSTLIRYEMPERGHVTLVVYDLLGRVVETLVDEVMPAGRHQVAFNAHRLATGVYFYRIMTGGFVATKKMLTIK